MLTVGKPVSLVQQKKQQWAQEREEMSNLYLPWGSGERYKNRLPIRNQFSSSIDLHKQTYDYQEPIQRQRSPSLPPIYNTEQEQTVIRENRTNKETINRNTSVQRFCFYDDDAEGDTSGYGSETVNHMAISNQSRNVNNNFENSKNQVVVAWHHDGLENRKQPSTERSNMNEGTLSARSQSGNEEGRPKWGDRGVATGRLWEPTVPSARLPLMQNHKKGTPSWVERGLNMIDNNSTEVLIIDQRGTTNSGMDCDISSYNGSDEGSRTFLRGQNVPLEPEVKAQRECKRIKALELQSAILSQLEEREKQRQEEREKQLREERLEELRIQRQQEEDRLRLEEERKKTIEKQAIEKNKLETLKKALEDAEKRAKQEKEKKFNLQKQTNEVNLNNNLISKPTENSANETKIVSPNKTLSPTKTNRTYNIPSSATSQIKETISHQSSVFNSPRSIAASNLNLFIHNVQPLSLTDSQINLVPIAIAGSSELISNQSSSNIQLAVLVPQGINKNMYNVTLNSQGVIETNGNEKLLTPSKYRNFNVKDAFTQTDVHICPSMYEPSQNGELESEIYKDYSNIDEDAPQDTHKSILKRDRRLRSEERHKKEIENRPKWGANRPAAQYKKQSEKDPFYTQKRKMRQKYRAQVRQYISQSSDDSRSPSPMSASCNKNLDIHIKPRNSLSQSFWRSKRYSQDFSADNSNSEMNNGKKSPNFSSTKRLTLSQKFINDKYGSKRMWTDDQNERNLRYPSNISINKKMEKLHINKQENHEKHIHDQ